MEASTAYGASALKVRGKLLACEPRNRSAESGSLAVCVDRGDRVHLIAEAPEAYYVTDHYVDYDMVLVRLAAIDADVLDDLLRMAHRFVTRKTPRSAASGKRPTPGSKKPNKTGEDHPR